MPRSRAVLPLVALVAGMLAVPSTAAAEERSRYVVMLRASVENPVSVAAFQARRYGAEATHVWTAVDGYSALLTEAEAAALAADPAVASVQPDGTFARIDDGPTPVPCQQVADPDTEQCLGENVDRIDAEPAGAGAADGGAAVGTGIAVIDSGVSRSHPDLNVVGGVDCGTGEPVPGPGAFDDHVGHGTLVAGVAAARDNGVGVVGVAAGAPIWSVKVAAADGSISDAAVLCAVDWVTATRQDDDPANDVAVANMSLGANVGSPDDGQCGLVDGDALHTAVCRSVDAGVLYVVAAGNESQDLAGTVPARYDEVLTATAMSDYDGRPGGLDGSNCFGQDFGALLGERDDAAATYSNWAVSPADRVHTMAAPGTCVPGPVPPVFGAEYGIASGTSFSAPALSGVAALCIDNGRCRAGEPLETRAVLMADAATHSVENPDYGFLGDPLRPPADVRTLAADETGERWYGYLTWAGHHARVSAEEATGP